MGVYYDYAVVHERVLIWWTDNNGVCHSKWIEGEDGQKLISTLSSLDFKYQQELMAAIRIKD